MATRRRRTRFGSSYVGGGEHAHWIVRRNGRVVTYRTDDDDVPYGFRSYDAIPGVGFVERRGCFGRIIKFVLITGLVLLAALVVLAVLASRR